MWGKIKYDLYLWNEKTPNGLKIVHFRPDKLRLTGDAAPRAEALQRYIKKESKNRKMIGGITIPVNGTWRYNDNEKYKYNIDDLSSWKILNL